MTVYVKRYNGSAWIDPVIARFNGSIMIEALVKRFNSSGWIQIYPHVPVSASESITGGSTLYNYRYNRGVWELDYAKQGDGSSYGADAYNLGYLDITSSGFPGYRNVNSVSSASYSATRGGAGQYNANQTMYFWRSGTTPNNGNPYNDTEGLFTCTTGSPGNGGRMNNRTISGLDNFTLWMNGVNNKNILYIADGTYANYLSVQSASTISASYVYITKIAGFENINSKMMTYSRRSAESNNIYHEMVIYPEEANMTLQEIIQYRTENNLDDISFNDVLTDYIPKIQLNGVTVTDKLEVELDYLNANHIPEFSFDKVEYIPFTSNEPDKYIGKLPADFNKNKDNIYIRVRNKLKDSIDFEYVKETLFLVP